MTAYQYKIVSFPQIADVENTVNLLALENWQLHGAVQVAATSAGRIIYTQCLVRPTSYAEAGCANKQ
jgi:hypothetical protein